MQIKLASVMVDNQENALRFYTATLGFVKNKDIPMGQFRWLTVSSPSEGARRQIPWGTNQHGAHHRRTL